MSQLEIDFGYVPAPASNQARRLSVPPNPDRDGLFDLDGVAIICGRRQCSFEPANDLHGHVRFKETRLPLTAMTPGRWEAAAILSACTRAHGRAVFEISKEKIQAGNALGLDELRIARIMGAAGIRPYWPRNGGTQTRALKWVLELTDPAAAEDAARARVTSDYSIRESLRALEDTGLLVVRRGSRGGMATGKCSWTTRAHLPLPEFSLYDLDALAQIAAGAV